MSSTPQLEECANCGRMIGRLETPCVFRDEVVCAECFSRLSSAIGYAAPSFRGSSTSSVLPAAEHTLTDRRPSSIPVARLCPSCGSTEQAVKKAKGSTVLLIILLLFSILPGLIYWIAFNGYAYVCPRCGFKYGDAT